MFYEIEFKELLRILQRRWKILIGIPVGLALLLGIFSFFSPKEYRAQTILYASGKNSEQANGITYEELEAGQLLAKDMKEIVKQRSTLEQVILELGIEKAMTLEALLSKIDVQVANNTRIAMLRVKDADPNLAAKLANKLGEVVMLNAADVMNASGIKIMERAVPPLRPINVGFFLAFLVGGMAGFLLAILFIVVLEGMQKRIYRLAKVESIFKQRILVELPVFSYSLHNQIWYNDQKNGWWEVFKRLKITLLQTKKTDCLKEILITGSMAGEGKTTVSIGLGKALAMGSARVVLVDVNVKQAPLEKFFGIRGTPKKTLSHLLKKEAVLEEMIYKTKQENVDVVIWGEDEPFPEGLFESGEFVAFQKFLREKYDYILYNGAPFLEIADILSLSTQVEGVLMVCAMGETMEKEAQKSSELLQTLPINVLGIVANKSFGG